MESFVVLIVWALFAYWCYTIAKKNGRSTGWAIFMGLLFGIFAVIVYAIIGKTKELKEAELEESIYSIIEDREYEDELERFKEDND